MALVDTVLPSPPWHKYDLRSRRPHSYFSLNKGYLNLLLCKIRRTQSSSAMYRSQIVLTSGFHIYFTQIPVLHDFITMLSFLRMLFLINVLICLFQALKPAFLREINRDSAEATHQGICNMDIHRGNYTCIIL